MKDAVSPTILGLAAVIAAICIQVQAFTLQRQLDACEANFQGFRDGVIYGK